MIGHEVIGLSWPMAFVLGALVSPTDPIAATAIMRRLGAPRRLVNIIEGESLVNDASALVAYRVALAAAVGGSVLRGRRRASSSSGAAAGGGIAIGLAVGYVVAEIRRRMDDSPTENTISLLTAYAAFIPADELGLSGVLAAVTTGLYLGWRAPEVASPQTRLQGFALWEILVFLLNATLFILIGLQLPVIVDGLQGRGAGEVIGYSALVGATVIEEPVSCGSFTVSLSGPGPSTGGPSNASGAAGGLGTHRVCRGPEFAARSRSPRRWRCRWRRTPGAPLPDRDLILFITFAVILVTLVGQGLTLPALIRRLGVGRGRRRGGGRGAARPAGCVQSRPGAAR